MHCTATKGGTLSSTLAPGAEVASVRAVSRTADASWSRAGVGNEASRSQSATASTAARVCAGSTARRAGISDRSVGEAEELNDVVVAAGGVAAVDDDGLAGDEGRVGRYQECRHRGDLLGPAPAVKGVLASQ